MYAKISWWVVEKEKNQRKDEAREIMNDIEFVKVGWCLALSSVNNNETNKLELLRTWQSLNCLGSWWSYEGWRSQFFVFSTHTHTHKKKRENSISIITCIILIDILNKINSMFKMLLINFSKRILFWDN